MTTETLNTGTTDTAPAAATTAPEATAAAPVSPVQQATETAAAPAAPEAPDAPQPKAPESYDFKIPEGADKSAFDDFAKVAKDLDLNQADAQKLVDFQMGQAAKVSLQWAEQAKADTEIGGDKLAENLAVAKKGLEAYGTPELKAMLDKTGLGNNPEVIRFFYRAGKALSEDRVVQGGNATTPGPRNAASALYPNQPSA